MKDTVEAVRASRDNMEEQGLRRPYDDKVGVFPCRTFNLGSQTVTTPHVDDKNFAYAWCSVTALGNFNPNLGGHFVLWDFNLAVRFPPGSTIMIPSAIFIHSNASIQEKEERFSIVQYAAGGLFRWAQRGFMTEKEWIRRQVANGALQGDLKGDESDDIEKAKEGGPGENNFAAAAAMFTKLDELMEGGHQEKHKFA